MRRAIVAAGAAAALLVLAGCGSGADSSRESSSGGTMDLPAEESRDDDGGGADSADQVAPDSSEDAAPEAGADGGSAAVNQAAQMTERDIIYTIDLSITADDVPAAAAQAAGIATAAGGFVADERSSGDEHSTITLKVPSAGHTDAVARLEGLGEVTDRNRSTQDVTQEVVDTASRIASQQASITRVRALLAGATDLTEIISIEDELSSREADLDALLSRQKELASLTSMATITVNLAARDEGPVEEPEEDDTGFLAGLGGGWKAFTGAVTVTLTVIGALLPFAVLAAIIGVPVVTVLRRRRGSRAGRNAVTPQAEAPPAA